VLEMVELYAETVLVKVVFVAQSLVVYAAAAKPEGVHAVVLKIDFDSVNIVGIDVITWCKFHCF